MMLGLACHTGFPGKKNTHIRKNVCQVYKGEIEEKLLTGCSNQLMERIMPNRAAAVKYFLHFISSQCVFNHLFCSLISKIQINRLLGVKIIFYIKPKSDRALQIIFQQTANIRMKRPSETFLFRRPETFAKPPFRHSCAGKEPDLKHRFTSQTGSRHQHENHQIV